MKGQKYGFGISPYMQELMAYVGHFDCYGRCEELMEKFTFVRVAPSQIYRVTDHVSASLKSEDHKIERTLEPVSKENILYVEIDGSMIQTRKNDEPWKEVKLGRLFRDVDCLNPNSDASYLSASQYVGHFGNHTDFCKKLGGVIEAYGELKDRLVFINDGATWIREWITDNYPLAASVLDYYHATEYLYEFAEKTFCDKAQKDKWCEVQKDLLLASGVETVLENILSLPARTSGVRSKKIYYWLQGWKLFLKISFRYLLKKSLRKR